MSLQTRLMLACLGIIALFLSVFVATLTLMGGSHLFMPPGMTPERIIQDRLCRAYHDGGWAGVERGVGELRMPPETGIQIFRKDSQPKTIAGNPFPVDQELLERAWADQSAHLRPPHDKEGPGREHRDPHMFHRPDEPPQHFGPRPGRPHGPSPELYIPVTDRGEVFGVVQFSVRGREAMWRIPILLISSLLAGTVGAFLAGIWISRTIARPIETMVTATQALAGSDFRHRISTEVPGEMRQLADSFNLMAQNLEVTISCLTEAKEKAEQSEASRRQFLADVSHNLRTPLAAMLGWTEALIDGLTTPEEQPVQLLNIRQQTLYIAQNVQRLLDWSRWEDQPPKLAYQQFPVSEPLMETLQTLQEVAQSRNISMVLVGLEDEPLVRGDRTRVRELFQLLLENAVHHNPEGISITVKFSQEGSRLRVSVLDNGQGLPAELIADLQCRVGGGLGLAIACRLAVAHGGALRWQPSVGTDLSFTLESVKSL